ncbi:MAG: hypothetical protein C5B50_09595 [Verrucomicrobia bacterium]|nr:MAG: hypothetical protein C5B50_09595 [Verrucomicrobiota bacterium]
MKILSFLAYLMMVGGLIGLIVLKGALSSFPFGVAVQILAVLLITCARVAFGRRSFHVTANPTEGGLVTTGPYRYIRHPIYAAVCLFTTAAVAAHCSWLTLLCGGAVWASALVRIPLEEKLVSARYPEYRQYAARTSRLIPYVF